MKRYFFLFLLLSFLAGCGVNNQSAIRSTIVSPDKDPRYQGRVYRPSSYVFNFYNESRNIRMKFLVQYERGEPKLFAELGPEEGSKIISFTEPEFTLIIRGEQYVNGRWKKLGEKKMPFHVYPSDHVRTFYLDENDFFLGRVHWIPYSSW